jgi:hypothetical protein
MDAFARLIARILMGARYEAPSERDTRRWISVLAVLPLLFAIIHLTVAWMADAPLIYVWAGLVVLIVVFAGVVQSVYSLRHRSIRLGIVLFGWGILLCYLGQQFVALMRY